MYFLEPVIKWKYIFLASSVEQDQTGVASLPTRPRHDSQDRCSSLCHALSLRLGLVKYCDLSYINVTYETSLPQWVRINLRWLGFMLDRDSRRPDTASPVVIVTAVSRCRCLTGNVNMGRNNPLSRSTSEDKHLMRSGCSVQGRRTGSRTFC